jgi:hypothetical protein
MARADDKANELVTITTAATVFDAEVMCAALRAAGIQAFVPNENSSTMLPHMIGAINPNGVPVVVRSSDVPAAQAVLTGKAPPSAGHRRGQAGPDRPGSRKDDRYAPPPGPDEEQAENEAWGEGQDEEEAAATDYDDRDYDEEEEGQDADEEDGAFDEDDRDGDEYAGDQDEESSAGGRNDRWDGSPAGRDRDGRQRDAGQRDGGERRTLKFDDYQDSGKTDRSDQSDQSDDWSDGSGESDDWSDFEDYEQDEQDDQAPADTAADRHAAAAARSILFTWWFPPAALWTLYCISQAMQARQVEPPADPEQFQSNLWCAVLAGLGCAVLASIVYYHILAHW